MHVSWLVLVLLVTSSAHAAEPVPVAVSYFENSSGKADLAPLEKGLADMLITDLAVSDELVIVERARLEAVVNELRLQHSAWADKASAQRLGKGLGAAYLLTGAFIVDAKTMRIDVRVVDVASGAVVLTTKAAGTLDDFFAIEQQLASSLLDGLGAKLTLLAKKRIGAGSTTSFEAFQHYCRSLEARDRHDESGERDALAKALAADPEFGRVKARVAALETKVAALEVAGGRILRPSSAADHLHNARIEREQGKRDAAIAAVRSAAAVAPGLLDVWLMVRALDAGLAVPRDMPGLTTPLRRLVDAYLKGDADVLWTALADARERLQAAVLLFDLVAPELPAPTLRRFRMVVDAVLILEGAASAHQLEGLVLDPAALATRVQRLRQQQLGGERWEQIQRQADAAFVNRVGYAVIFGSWELIALTMEEPRDLVLTIEREASHPHWKEKPASRAAHPIAVEDYAKLVPPAELAAIKAAIASPSGLVYQATRDVDPYVPLENDPPVAGSLGKPIAIPAKSIKCKPSASIVTGTSCASILRIPFGVLPPGLYRLTLDYRDRNGKAVHVSTPTWAREVELVESLGPQNDRGDYVNARLLHRLADFTQPRHRGAVEALLAKVVSKRPLVPAYAVMVSTWFRNHQPGTRGPHVRYIDRIAWDVDFALRGGKDVVESDYVEWQRYRDQILSKGWAIRADVDEDVDYLALPALTKGEHTICVATQRADGTRSAEAECTRIVVD